MGHHKLQTLITLHCLVTHGTLSYHLFLYIQSQYHNETGCKPLSSCLYNQSDHFYYTTIVHVTTICKNGIMIAKYPKVTERRETDGTGFDYLMMLTTCTNALPWTLLHIHSLVSHFYIYCINCILQHSK